MKNPCTSQCIKSSGSVHLIFLIILLVPLFFLNVKNSHDWGGDFAQYIHQAKNFAEGIPQEDNGYIYNDQYPSLAPQVYPPGFPLMLAPVYLLFGNDMLAFTFYMSALLCMMSVCLYFFFRQHFSFIISLLASLVITYNPWMLNFKTEIIADIPFTLFALLFLLQYKYIREKGNTLLSNVYLTLLCLVLLLVKSIAIVFLISLALDIVIRFIRSYAEQGKNLIKSLAALYPLSVPLAAFLFYYIINSFLIPSQKDPLVFFPSLFNLHQVKEIFFITSRYYIETFEGFFQPDTGKWIFITLIVRAFALAFTLLGFILSLMKKLPLYEWITIGFLAVYLLFPNTSQGFRYLLPVLPLFLYYIIIGLKAVRTDFKVSENFVAFLLASVVLLTYKPGIEKIIREEKQLISGPFEPEALETWDYIRNNTPADAVIAFIKPTVLALYGERKSIANHFEQDLESLDLKFREKEVDYYLIADDLRNVVLENYIENNRNEISLDWSNSRFRLYRRIR